MDKHGSGRRPPARWQLYLFMGAMVGGALALFRLGIASQHERLFGAVWITLALLGMGLWLRRNERALREEERAARRAAEGEARRLRWYRHGRTIPLTPVQLAFLERTGDRREMRDEDDRLGRGA